MKHAPNDSAFNRAIRNTILQSAFEKAVVFIDNDNKVREVVGEADLASGAVDRIRADLEERKVLKAVLYVAESVYTGKLGSISTVEYLPTSQYYSIEFKPASMNWVEYQDRYQEGGNGQEQ